MSTGTSMGYAERATTDRTRTVEGLMLKQVAGQLGITHSRLGRVLAWRGRENLFHAMSGRQGVGHIHAMRVAYLLLLKTQRRLDLDEIEANADAFWEKVGLTHPPRKNTNGFH